MYSALNAVANPYFSWFDKPVKATIIFNIREYKFALKGWKKSKVTLGDSWSFWMNKIYNHWRVIEGLHFIKDFRGLDKLGYELEELMAMIFHIDDLETRLKVIKALQDNQLYIYPVF